MAVFNGSNLGDIINGTSLADQIFGNGGNDRLAGNGGNDVIRGGSGQDIIEGGAGDDILFADANDGGLNEDVLFGGADSDILVSGAGRDHFNGASGVDAASWQESAFAVTADVNTGRGVAGGTEDTFTLVENLIGSRHGDTLFGDEGRNGLFGGEGADRLFGRDGNDELSGGAGNDTLDGGTGINTLRGGSGIDTVDYGALARGIEVDLTFDGVNASSFNRFDALAEVEVVKATNVRDVLLGDAASNQFFGRGGNDRIDGGEGDDLLSGGAGADVFEFVARPAHFLPAVNSGFDRITDFARSEGDLINLRAHQDATDFATLRADARQVGDDTLLRLGEDAIVIDDMALSDLSAAMFVF